MIYVDSLKKYAPSEVQPSARRLGLWWSHMVTDGDLAELHAFARKIGLRRSWFQGSPRHRHPHYDLTPGRRQAAVEMGAVEVDTRGLLRAVASCLARPRT